jgi:hypothetical protein
MKQQSSLVAIGLAATAAVVCVLGWLHLAGAKASAQDAAANATQMRAYETQILQLRSLDSNVHLLGEQPVETTSSWVNFAKTAGIAERQLAEINRLSLQKIEKTSYSRDDVFIRLNAVTVEQVVSFCLQCSDASVGYSPLSVHLSAGRGGKGEPETWIATLILTRILYTATNER